ncbi:PepSY domain-containing protein [Domibacillus aminovorans]|uniref:PepSY domain-containing protein n=1 Tax=Domibacillus aminovorans TaxID=29332 RepID=A0A177L788_9BACI|nr:PepSY domain-containing protein [Domibacillus aminovorans]OAH61324.1 hypothetical protein AWH49_12995 [Domibacillus aminovorans]
MKKRTMAGGLLAIGLIGGGAVWGVQTDKIQAEVPSVDVKLMMEEAKAIAEKETKAVVKSIELEREWNGLVYEVDTDSDDIDIDGNTGEILKTERDDHDDNNEVVNVTVTQEEAIAAAKKKVKGNVTNVELDDGRYEIEVRNGKTETDVYVHGATGEVTVGETDTDD